LGVKINDNILSKLIRTWVGKVQVPIRLPAFVFADIEIMNNGLLNVASPVRQLIANKIVIHIGGRLNIQGSFCSINCTSIKGDVP
jgi:hypothetical protein